MKTETLSQKIETADHKRILTALLILQLLILVPLGFYRLIDGDEGYYILAAKCILDGKIPYTDFFYTQMPLMPYVYAFWMKLFGVSWYSARFFSVTLSVFIGFLIYHCIFCTIKRRDFSILSVLIYLFSSWTFGWNTVVKTYALSTSFLMCAYWLIMACPGKSRRWRYLLSGLMLGFAADTRLFFICTAIAFFPQILKESGNKKRKFIYFSAGIGIALLPNIIFLLLDSDAYYFGNLGYHAMRTSEGLIGGIGQKFFVFQMLLGITSVRGVIGFQNMLLVLPIIYFMISKGCRKKKSDPAFFIVILLTLVSFLPTPAYIQYFSVTLPFVIIIVIYALDDFTFQLNKFSDSHFVHHIRFIISIMIIAYCAVSPFDMYRYTVTGKKVPGIGTRENSVNWKISTVNEIAQLIDRHNTERKPVISCWPGYFVETESRLAEGMENHFGIFVSWRMDAETRQRYKLVSFKEMAELAASDEVTAVFGNCFYPVDKFKERLIQLGYSRIDSVYDAEIWGKIK